jgi:hypothetical protein
MSRIGKNVQPAVGKTSLATPKAKRETPRLPMHVEAADVDLNPEPARSKSRLEQKSNIQTKDAPAKKAVIFKKKPNTPTKEEKKLLDPDQDEAQIFDLSSEEFNELDNVASFDKERKKLFEQSDSDQEFDRYPIEQKKFSSAKIVPGLKKPITPTKKAKLQFDETHQPNEEQLSQTFDLPSEILNDLDNGASFDKPSQSRQMEFDLHPNEQKKGDPAKKVPAVKNNKPTVPTKEIKKPVVDQSDIAREDLSFEKLNQQDKKEIQLSDEEEETIIPLPTIEKETSQKGVESKGKKKFYF